MILPLRAILFQSLFLLVAIAIESFILQQRLYISRKTSIEYAASLNFFSTFLGWLVFFFVRQTLPPELEKQLISYLFFSRFAPNSTFLLTALYLEIILIAFLSFLFTFVTELIGFNLLQRLLYQKPEEGRNSTHTEINQYNVSNSTTFLVANTFSFLAILGISLFKRILPNL